MKTKTNILLAGFGLLLAVFATSGCGAHASQSTTPTVPESALESAEQASEMAAPPMDGDYDERTIVCPPEGDCNVTVPILPKKRSCLGAIALGGLAGTAGGAAYGSIKYPNDVEVSEDRVDVWFDATWKYAAVGAGASALVTGIVCYATR